MTRRCQHNAGSGCGVVLSQNQYTKEISQHKHCSSRRCLSVFIQHTRTRPTQVLHCSKCSLQRGDSANLSQQVEASRDPVIVNRPDVRQ